MTARRPGTIKIAIASAGRFHLLDLARELDALGCEVSFYSYVPFKRARKFGLRERCHVGLFPYVFPLVLLERITPLRFQSILERLKCWMLDRLVIWKMRPCDFFICMSGIYLAAPRYAKNRYGAKVILHRGSDHILVQREILFTATNAQHISEFTVCRELEGYVLADQISVASHHVEESFRRWPAQAAKVHRNPYGVDVLQFPFVDRKDESAERTVLYVGHWSYRKGVDILVNAISSLDGIRLLHVGPLTDSKFPSDARFIHHDPVSQDRLVDFYKRACVFVLASREDGFGVVLSQALVSGCLVVCSDRTGAPDLSEIGDLGRLIRIVRAGDATALAAAISTALFEAKDESVIPISQAEREQLSWRRYAERELNIMSMSADNPRTTFRDAASYGVCDS
jgi:glycosyltransferase involved in cell wall biosynthesis